MKTAPALLLATLLAGAAQAAERPLAMDIAAGKVDEVCLPLKAGQTIHWRFTASAPVDFNLHHHVGQKVLMPVDVKATKRHEGKFVADAANDWCLMWTAPKAQAARVEGGFATDDVLR
jgi:hypothetical protein